MARDEPSQAKLRPIPKQLVGCFQLRLKSRQCSATFIKKAGPLPQPCG
jgi:hypothetical protein